MRLSLNRNITQSQRDVVARRRTFQHSRTDAIQLLLHLLEPVMLERANRGSKRLCLLMEPNLLLDHPLGNVAAVVNDKQHSESQSQHQVDRDKKLRPDRPWPMLDHCDNPIVSLILSQATASNLE